MFSFDQKTEGWRHLPFSDHHKDEANVTNQGWKERWVTNGERCPDPLQGGNEQGQEQRLSKARENTASFSSTSWNYLTCAEDDPN